MKITDRTKDVIKSGGEWISSIDVENAAMSHPGVKLAATVAAYHPKWDERPVLVVVPSDSGAPSRQEIIDHLTPRMAKWWLPDDVVFVKEMPMNATGKILKARLREQYWHHLHAG
jgi:fatty-acyl-CoA synthase